MIITYELIGDYDHAYAELDICNLAPSVNLEILNQVGLHPSESGWIVPDWEYFEQLAECEEAR